MHVRWGFKVSECRVASSSSPGKTVSGTPYDRIKWPWSMTPMNAMRRPFSAYTAGTSSGVPYSLEEVVGWFG